MKRRHASLGLFIAILCAPFVFAGEPPAEKPQPIDYKKLKELMPEELLGQKRTKLEGEKITIGEFNISQATGRFGDDSKEGALNFEVQFIDYSAAKEMADAMAAWRHMEIDKEGDDGFERTRKIHDQPAFESFQKEGKSGSVSIYIANRYLVNITLNNVTAEDVKRVGDSIPVKKLAELK